METDGKSPQESQESQSRASTPTQNPATESSQLQILDQEPPLRPEESDEKTPEHFESANLPASSEERYQFLEEVRMSNSGPSRSFNSSTLNNTEDRRRAQQSDARVTEFAGGINSSPGFNQTPIPESSDPATSDHSTEVNHPQMGAGLAVLGTLSQGTSPNPLSDSRLTSIQEEKREEEGSVQKSGPTFSGSNRKMKRDPSFNPEFSEIQGGTDQRPNTDELKKLYPNHVLSSEAAFLMGTIGTEAPPFEQLPYEFDQTRKIISPPPNPKDSSQSLDSPIRREEFLKKPELQLAASINEKISILNRSIAATFASESNPFSEPADLNPESHFDQVSFLYQACLDLKAENTQQAEEAVMNIERLRAFQKQYWDIHKELQAMKQTSSSEVVASSDKVQSLMSQIYSLEIKNKELANYVNLSDEKKNLNQSSSRAMAEPYPPETDLNATVKPKSNHESEPTSLMKTRKPSSQPDNSVSFRHMGSGLIHSRDQPSPAGEGQHDDQAHILENGFYPTPDMLMTEPLVQDHGNEVHSLTSVIQQQSEEITNLNFRLQHLQQAYDQQAQDYRYIDGQIGELRTQNLNLQDELSDKNVLIRELKATIKEYGLDQGASAIQFPIMVSQNFIKSPNELFRVENFKNQTKFVTMREGQQDPPPPSKLESSPPMKDLIQKSMDTYEASNFENLSQISNMQGASLARSRSKGQVGLQQKKVKKPATKIVNQFAQINLQTVFQNQLSSVIMADQLLSAHQQTKKLHLENVELAKTQHKVMEQELKQLQLENEDLKKEIKQLQVEETGMKTKFTQILDKFQKFIEQSDKKMTEAKLSYVNQIKERDEIDQQQRLEQGQVLDQLNATISDMDQALRELQSELNLKQSDLLACQTELERLEKENDFLKEKTDGLQANVNQEKFHMLQIETLKDEIEFIRTYYEQELGVKRNSQIQKRLRESRDAMDLNTARNSKEAISSKRDTSLRLVPREVTQGSQYPLDLSNQNEALENKSYLTAQVPQPPLKSLLKNRTDSQRATTISGERRRDASQRGASIDCFKDMPSSRGRSSQNREANDKYSDKRSDHRQGRFAPLRVYSKERSSKLSQIYSDSQERVEESMAELEKKDTKDSFLPDRGVMSMSGETDPHALAKEMGGLMYRTAGVRAARNVPSLVPNKSVVKKFIGTYQQQFDQMERELTLKDTQINDLRNQVDTIRTKAVAESGLDELKEELQKVLEENNSLHQENRDLRDQLELDDLQAKYSDLQARLEQFHLERADLLRKLEDGREENRTLTHKVRIQEEGQTGLIEEKTRDLETLRQKIVIIAEQFEKKAIDPSKYDVDLLCEFIFDKIKRLKQKNDSLSSEIKVLQQERSFYFQKKVTALNSQNKALKQHSDMLITLILPSLQRLTGKPDSRADVLMAEVEANYARYEATAKHCEQRVGELQQALRFQQEQMEQAKKRRR